MAALEAKEAALHAANAISEFMKEENASVDSDILTIKTEKGKKKLNYWYTVSIM